MLKGSGKLINNENIADARRKGASELDAIKMIHMKKSKAEKKAEDKQGPLVESTGSNEYPYNTRISFDHDMMGKLGIGGDDGKEMPQVGDELHLRARAKVRSTSVDHDEAGKPRRRMELQMTHMGIGHKA